MTSTRSETPTQRGRPPIAGGWRTIEILATVLIGVAFGVAYWGWNQAYAGISVAKPFAGPLIGVLAAPWLIAGVVGAFLVRRPGAAIIAETIAASVEMLIGNEWGATTLVSGMLQGLGVELAFALLTYRVFHVVVGMVGAALAAGAETAYEWDIYWAGMTTAWKLQYLGWFALSGAVVAGVGGWAISRAIAATGAVDGLASGREHARRRAV